MNRVIPVILAACLTAGCASFQQKFAADLAAAEAWVANFVAQVKAKVPVVEADIQQAVALVCGLVPAAQSSSTALQASIKSPPPSVNTALNNANNALTTASAACAGYNTTPPATPSATANLVVQVWNGYVQAKQQLATATTGAGSAAAAKGN